MPVAGLIALSYVGQDSPASGVNAQAGAAPTPFQALAQQLLEQTPGNPLLLAQIGSLAPNALSSSNASISSALTQFPHNYLLVTVNSWLQGQQRQPLQQLKADWQAVRCSPRNASAWLELANNLSAMADVKRQGRSITELNTAELRYINDLYPIWQASAFQATLAAPSSGRAWLELARAASFNGDAGAADSALEEALAVAPDSPQVYAWGLQMYQPKWQDNPPRLWQLAQAAAADEKRFTLLAPDILEALQAAKLDDAQAQRLSHQAVIKLEALTHLNPPDANIQRKLGFFFWTRKQNEPARLAFENWVRLKPQDAEAHYWLAEILYSMGQYDATVTEYRAAIRLNPDSPALLALGTYLAWKGEAAEAESLLQRYLQLHPVSAQAHRYRGEALLAVGKLEEARTELKLAVQQDRKPSQNGQPGLGEFGQQAQELLDKNPAPAAAP